MKLKRVSKKCLEDKTPGRLYVYNTVAIKIKGSSFFIAPMMSSGVLSNMKSDLVSEYTRILYYCIHTPGRMK